jgi:hypothetical protein
MMNVQFLPLVFSLLAFAVSAGEQPPNVDLDLEPCINGAVSVSGVFPTQAMEEQIEAYLAWSSEAGRMNYLFEVMGAKPSEK